MRASSRRRSTTGIPIRRATSTTSPTRRGARRWTLRSRTRWGSADTTVACSSDVPTDVAPDGSPVEIYRRLPATGEPELIHGAIPAGASILELGCGAGRITHELIRLGQ